MASLREVYYDLACIPVLLLDLLTKETLVLPPTERLELLFELNKGPEKSGFASILLGGETVKCTRHAEVISGVKTAVVEVGGNWVMLSCGLLVRGGKEGVAQGAEVIVRNTGNGSIDLEVIRPPPRSSLSLSELQSLHYTYYPLLSPESIDIDQYPATIGSSRIRIDYLKLLKPFKPAFALQVDSLKTEYSSWRKCRGDGNCYYRAVAFSFLEYLCRSGVSPLTLREFYMKIYLQTGYFSLSQWSDEFDKYYICALIRLKELITFKELLGSAVEQLEYIYLQDPAFDISMIYILKLCVWNYLSTHISEISDFLVKSMDEMKREILAEGLESEGVVFKAMASVLDAVIVHVVMPDAQETVCKQRFVTEEKGKKPVLTLLLRPGHYDVLYTLQADFVDRYNFATYTYTGLDPDVTLPSQLYQDLI